MKPSTRTASGALLMLMITPVVVGLLACMPVPIGDPERSRIDPDINGIWVWLGGNGDPGFYAFEPYDKRTWFLTGVSVEEGKNGVLSNYELESYADLAALIEKEVVGDTGVTATETVMYKAWRTKLGGEWFMTWEMLAPFAEDDFEPEYWYVFRIDKTDANTIDLHLVNGDNDVFKGLEKTRRAYEKALRKNAKNEKIFDGDPIRLIRVKPEHRAFVSELASEVISVDE